VLAFAAGAFLTAQARDCTIWTLFTTMSLSIHELDRARAANHYDMEGTEQGQSRTARCGARA